MASTASDEYAALIARAQADPQVARIMETFARINEVFTRANEVYQRAQRLIDLAAPAPPRIVDGTRTAPQRPVR